MFKKIVDIVKMKIEAIPENKRIIYAALLALIVAMVLLLIIVLASGENLDGTYICESNNNVRIVIEGDNYEVTDAFGVTKSGKYTVNGDKLFVEYEKMTLPIIKTETPMNDKNESSFSSKGNTITVDGVKYIKLQEDKN